MTIVRPNVLLFQTIIFKDEIPIYYEISKDETKFIWEPDKKNGIENLPTFTIWKERHGWVVKTRDINLINQNMIEQAIEDLRNYYD